MIMSGASANEAVAVTERMRTGVAEAHPGGLPVTMSFGVSSCQSADTDFTDPFQAADAALYAAKAAGRNRVVAADMTMIEND
jgi:diguanylate cyclase (GGDEF)-like protein